MLPFVLVGGVPVLAGEDRGQLVGLSVPDVLVAPFDLDEIVGSDSVDPAAVFWGAEMRMARPMRQAAAGRRAGRFQPRGDRFEPLPEGEVSGFPSTTLLAHRAEVPSVDVVRLSSLFAVSTVRTPIDKAEASFLCFTKLYDARQRRELPTVDEIKQCFRGLQNTKSRMFSEVAAYAPVIHDAIGRGLKDRDLRRYLVRETPLPTGLGVAKMSFTLALLGHDCICLDTRLMVRMFGDKALKIEAGWGKDGDHVSELSLSRYEAVEDAFLEGNPFYNPKDPIGKARAQWSAWEGVGGKAASHWVWLHAIQV